MALPLISGASSQFSTSYQSLGVEASFILSAPLQGEAAPCPSLMQLVFLGGPHTAPATVCHRSSKSAGPPPPGPSAGQTGRGQKWGGESGEAGAGPSQQHGLSTPSPLPTSEPNPRERAPQPPTQAGPGEAGLRDLRLRRSSAPRETGVQGGS